MDAARPRSIWTVGTHEHDIKADLQPYHQNGLQHLKLRFEGYVTTSVLLIVQN
ncbi:hypothetical protein X767_32290 [Mesorhizobium sp. LSJC264A00]|nr:hypothetical protein X767_32290 [Mesorhizobium sp. LSJC264A00]ESX91352.1 hypothetical protein X756_04250 [Mesorhizobium sp. LSHC412B00]